MVQVIGIDIGGTKINALVCDSSGNIILQKTVSTGGKFGKNHVFQKLKDLIKELQSETVSKISAIGIGSPGYIDVRCGKVVYSCGIIRDWVDVNLAEELQLIFGLPVAVDNDANVAAIGEGWLGSAGNLSEYMVITLGTSVGGSYVNRLHGVLHGFGWRGGEIGHSILYPEGRKCLCGQRGCAELYLSGTALANRYRELGGTAADAKEVFRAIELKDSKALTVKEEFINDFATLLISLQNILDPQAFIVGGGLIHTKLLWWDDLNRLLRLKSNRGVDIKVIPARLLNQAGALGAAHMALNLLENKNESIN